MRLALVIYDSLDTLSGGYLYDRMLVRHLREQGDTVDIVSLPWRNYALHLTQNVSPGLRLHGYEAVLQDELNHPSLFLANRLGPARERPPRLAIVHHLRSSERRPAWQNALYGWVERAYLTSVTGYIFNSDTTRRSVESLVGLGWPSVTAYPGANHLSPPLDPAQISERAARPGPLRLIFIGNVIPRKGLGVLLDALNRLEGEWVLNIVGRTDADRRYADRIRARTAHTPRVKLLGALTDSEVRTLLAESDLLAMPSTYEGFGIVYLEGMAFGLPAVGTTAGAAREIITHERDGFLIDPHDARALATHLQAVLNERQRLLGMSLAARERFARHPSWDQSLAAVRAFIQKTVSQPAGGRLIS